MSQPPQTRRDFLRSAVRTTVRFSLMGALGCLAVVLVRRQQNCTTRGGCNGCNLSTDCVLPWKEAKR